MLIKRFFNKKIVKQISKGFTIAELMIVIAIMGLVTTIALANQTSLSNNVLLSNLAYEIGLSLREAQTYGISVKAGDSTDGFRGGYGVLFKKSTPTEYYLFHDRNDNQFPDDDEIVDTYRIQNQRGNEITFLCFGSPCGVDEDIEYITIIFRRPNPEPIFGTGSIGGGGVLIPNPVFQTSGSANIVVNNQSRDNCKTIIVEPTGQIRVDSSIDGSVCEN